MFSEQRHALNKSVRPQGYSSTFTSTTASVDKIKTRGRSEHTVSLEALLLVVQEVLSGTDRVCGVAGLTDRLVPRRL